MTNKKNAAFLTAIFCSMILSLYAANKIGFLINPSYFWYVLASSCFSLLMALIYLFPFDLSSILISIKNKTFLFDRLLFLTLLISTFTVPIKPLGSSSINVLSEGQIGFVKKSTDSPAVKTSPSVISSLDLSEWVITLEYADTPQQFEGQAIIIDGFVSKYTDNGFMLSIFLISCCVVDATLVSMLIVSSDRPAIDSWHKVEGRISVSGRQPNQTFSVNQTSINSLETPSNPYKSK